jgi:hypothetical protein
MLSTDAFMPTSHAGATSAHNPAILTPFVVKIKYKTANSGLQGLLAAGDTKSD